MTWVKGMKELNLKFWDEKKNQMSFARQSPSDFTADGEKNP